jgi:hypothetical protein
MIDIKQYFYILFLRAASMFASLVLIQVSKASALSAFPGAEDHCRQSQGERGDEISSQFPGGTAISILDSCFKFGKSIYKSTYGISWQNIESIATPIVLRNEEKQFGGNFGIFDLSSNFGNNEWCNFDGSMKRFWGGTDRWKACIISFQGFCLVVQ